jgi:hypothetical protein
MIAITENGDFVFGNIDEWGRVKINGFLDDGVLIVIGLIRIIKKLTTGDGLFWVIGG